MGIASAFCSFVVGLCLVCVAATFACFSGIKYLFGGDSSETVSDSACAIYNLLVRCMPVDDLVASYINNELSECFLFSRSDC